MSSFISKSPLGINPNLHNLINPGILRNIQTILLDDIFAQKPPPDKMPPLVKPHARLRRRQTNQTARHELCPGALLGRPALDVPRTGRVDAQHGDGGGFELRDYGGEGFAEGTAEGKAEDGVDDEVCGFEGFGEVGDEGDGEVVELGFEALALV